MENISTYQMDTLRAINSSQLTSHRCTCLPFVGNLTLSGHWNCFWLKFKHLVGTLIAHRGNQFWPPQRRPFLFLNLDFETITASHEVVKIIPRGPAYHNSHILCDCNATTKPGLWQGHVCVSPHPAHYFHECSLQSSATVYLLKWIQT